jgi:hypothetical protein
MNNLEPDGREPTAVDDVRRVRERIAAEHRGNIREHMAETNRIFEELRAKLNLRPVSPPQPESQRNGTRG